MYKRDTVEAQRTVGFASGGRPKGDFYVTPSIAVEKLLDVESFINEVNGQPSVEILEPCCGNGAISKVLESRGYEVFSRDLFDWGYGIPDKDFLKEPIIDVDGVVTNPPFNLSLQFTERALECTRVRNGKVAILNRIQWLEGQRRNKLFTCNPLSKVYIFSKRLPRMQPHDYTGKIGTSLIGFAWYVFDWKHQGEPIIRWL